jgi:2-polyprenyl-6-hydroxyphenyl methylase / 3-demethylubiquinone-9 3-methyltransferase
MASNQQNKPAKHLQIKVKPDSLKSMTPKTAQPPMSSARPQELQRFNQLAATWWDSKGPMRPLHVVNTLREQQVLAQAARHFHRPMGDWRGLRVADIGCGGGLMCEPLAARGAQVVGLDAAAHSIAAARLHARSSGLDIDYRVGEPSTALRPDEQFDVLLLLEVVEHVTEVASFVQQVSRHLAPGGLLIASTINRTLRSFLFAIVAAEYVFRVLPVGTHRWSQFVRPEELAQAATASGLQPAECLGMRYLPGLHRAWWTRDPSVNYLAGFVKP